MNRRGGPAGANLPAPPSMPVKTTMQGANPHGSGSAWITRTVDVKGLTPTPWPCVESDVPADRPRPGRYQRTGAWSRGSVNGGRTPSDDEA
jgi:hypothetical protein